MEKPNSNGRRSSKSGGFFARAAGGVASTLEISPDRDVSTVRWHGMTLCFTGAYTATTLSLLGERLFNPSGWGHLAVILGGVSLSALVACLDRSVFGGAYLTAGIRALKDVGVRNLPDGGALAIFKTTAIVCIRAAIALAFSGLGALTFGLVLYAPDIEKQLASVWREANAPLITAAEQTVDAQISRATSAVAAEEAKVDDLSRQQDELRSVALDPVAADPQVAAIQTEVDKLEAEASTADAAADDASTIAANEAGGEQTPQTSGVAGVGPKARAAASRAQTSANRAQQVDSELSSERQRFEQVRAQVGANASGLQERAQDQLKEVTTELTAESSKLDDLRQQQGAMVSNKERAEQAILEATAGYTKPDNGLLAQVSALHFLMRERVVALIVVLVEIGAFSIEMGFVISRFSMEARTYCALLAEQMLTEISEIADRLVSRLNRRDPDTGGRSDDLPPDPHSPPSGRHDAGGASADGFANGMDANAPRRGPGRPRKHVD